MASDSKVFHRALEKWRDHHVRGEYSLTPRFGETAILFSTTGNVINETPEEIAFQIDYYEREAALLEKQMHEVGMKAVRFAGITLSNLATVVEDRGVSSIYLVGDGGFSYVYNDEAVTDDKDAYIDWKDISSLTTHLKHGLFVQRTCGYFAFDLSVPFGAFAMTRHSSVFSPVGKYFSPEAFPDLPLLGTPEEKKIVQVYPGKELAYSYVRATYNRETMKKASTDSSVE